MNHEIKFRAWHKEEKAMVYFDLFHIDEGRIDGSFENRWNLDECEIMRFTGLFDKIGKEVYEGDIIDDIGGIIIYDVELGGFCIEKSHAQRSQIHFSYLRTYRADFTIIGNIYETPEKTYNSK